MLEAWMLECDIEISCEGMDMAVMRNSCRFNKEIYASKAVSRPLGFG